MPCIVSAPLGVSLAKMPSGCKTDLFLRLKYSWKGFSNGKEGRLLRTGSHEDFAGLAMGGLRAHLSRSSFKGSLRIDRIGSSGRQIVSMMQTAEPQHRHNFSARIGVLRCLAAGGRFLRQPEMRSVVVVITDVVIHQAFEVPFIGNDDMVEQIPATVTSLAGHARSSNMRRLQVLSSLKEIGCLETAIRYSHIENAKS
jgi:hypothetical protein